MDNEDKNLGMIYESMVLNEGLISSLSAYIKDGKQKGLSLLDSLIRNQNQLIAILAVLSSLGFATKVDHMYKNHPEILQQHIKLTDDVKRDIGNTVGQILLDHPNITKLFLK